MAAKKLWEEVILKNNKHHSDLKKFAGKPKRKRYCGKNIWLIKKEEKHKERRKILQKRIKEQKRKNVQNMLGKKRFKWRQKKIEKQCSGYVREQKSDMECGHCGGKRYKDMEEISPTRALISIPKQAKEVKTKVYLNIKKWSFNTFFSVLI